MHTMVAMATIGSTHDTHRLGHALTDDPSNDDIAVVARQVSAARRTLDRELAARYTSGAEISDYDIRITTWVRYRPKGHRRIQDARIEVSGCGTIRVGIGDHFDPLCYYDGAWTDGAGPQGELAGKVNEAAGQILSNPHVRNAITLRGIENRLRMATGAASTAGRNEHLTAAQTLLAGLV